MTIAICPTPGTHDGIIDAGQRLVRIAAIDRDDNVCPAVDMAYCKPAHVAWAVDYDGFVVADCTVCGQPCYTGGMR